MRPLSGSSWYFLERSGTIVEEILAFSGWTARVTMHQTIMIDAPSTVVAPMIFSALSLDSWIPSC